MIIKIHIKETATLERIQSLGRTLDNIATVDSEAITVPTFADTIENISKEW